MVIKILKLIIFISITTLIISCNRKKIEKSFKIERNNNIYKDNVDNQIRFVIQYYKNGRNDLILKNDIKDEMEEYFYVCTLLEFGRYKEAYIQINIPLDNYQGTEEIVFNDSLSIYKSMEIYRYLEATKRLDYYQLEYYLDKLTHKIASNNIDIFDDIYMMESAYVYIMSIINNNRLRNDPIHEGSTKSHVDYISSFDFKNKWSKCNRYKYICCVKDFYKNANSVEELNCLTMMVKDSFQVEYYYRFKIRDLIKNKDFILASDYIDKYWNRFGYIKDPNILSNINIIYNEENRELEDNLLYIVKYGSFVQKMSAMPTLMAYYLEFNKKDKAEKIYKDYNAFFTEHNNDPIIDDKVREKFYFNIEMYNKVK